MKIVNFFIEKRLFFIEVTLFVLIFIILGILIVPSHWTSLWADREFTGWVAPISNRFVQGLVLYADGGHIPMPPLPFAIIYWLTRGKATWITESFLNFLFQSLTLLALYFSLNKILNRPIPFLSVFCAIPVFFALPKTIFYDSSSQFFVATSVLISTYYLYEGKFILRNDEPATNYFRKYLLLTLLSLSVATCTLCKQTSGAGTFVGMLFVILFFPCKATLTDKLKELTIFVCATEFFLVFWCVILAPLISVQGMLLDVFILSHEVKGGFNLLLSKLYNVFIYGISFSYLIIASFLTLLITNILKIDKIKISNNKNLLVLGACILFVSWLLFFINQYFVFFPPTALIETKLLNISFALLFILTYIILLYRHSLISIEIQKSFPILPLFFITFIAAIFYNLSVNESWWTYYNNPLIVFVIAGLYLTVFKIFNNFPKLNRNWLYAGIIILTLVILNVCSIRFKDQLDVIKRCSVPWIEIKHLKGAKLQESAQGMRDLVHLVQFLAPDASKDEVLLLPNDPNVESWFERKRPKLTSVIVFPDQYFDKYVDEDFERLQKLPPKVIIIGPRTYWRFFCGWLKVSNKGAERLTDRLLLELIPQKYQQLAPHKIIFGGYSTFLNVKSENYMDVFLRIDKKEISTPKTIYKAPEKQRFFKRLFQKLKFQKS